MRLLMRVADRVALRCLCDALSQRGIDHRIDGEQIQALLPLAGVFDARVMVAEEDWEAARRVLRDLGMEAVDA